MKIIDDKRLRKAEVLTISKKDKQKLLDSLVGIIPGDTTLEEIKDGRLKRQ